MNDRRTSTHTPGPWLIERPIGKTRGEFIADAMEKGATLGTAMALADAAGKKNGYRLTHEQMYAVTMALTAARLALAHTGDAAALIRADALDRVSAACDALIASATGEGQ